jgi:membrane-associated phospholipid phosphatase
MARRASLILASFPLIFATTICGSLSLDELHNWYDIVFGASIGIISALAAYRTRYAAIWDFRSVLRGRGRSINLTTIGLTTFLCLDQHSRL